MDLVSSILLALSLSVDSFVVSMGGSVTIGKANSTKVCITAFVFAFMQAFLLGTGWFLGSTIAGYIEVVSKYLGLVLLVYIGGSMIYEALWGNDEGKVDFSAFGKMLLAALATSIDAAAVGVSLAMSEIRSSEIPLLLAEVFACTFLLSAIGILGGSALGRKFGKPALVVGGIVLAGIGIKVFIG